MDTLSRLAQPPASQPLPEIDQQLPLEEDFNDFLNIFEDLRGLVPASFFLLFKIARVLKTPEGKLGDQLKGFYDICREADRLAAIDEKKAVSISKEVPVFSSHDPQFGTRRIKGLEEISAVGPNDVALEDFTELMRKADERELQVRVLMKDGDSQADLETAPIRDRGARQMTNAAEQKLYMLFDRSYSMIEHHRLLFAKLLTIEYLRRKKGSGARLFFRAFDYQVYQLEKITDVRDYDRLIRQLLYIEPGGKGTDIQHALLTAVEDIKFDGMLESAEILLITDGCDRVETDTLQEALGENIKLHMVKIGRDAAEPSTAEVKEMIAEDHTFSVMDRDQLAAYFKKQLMQVWDELSETLIETDDLDAAEMQFGEDEVRFTLEAAEQVLATDTQQMTTAEIELAFRKASFVEGFCAFLQERAESSPAIAARKNDLDAAMSRLHEFKLRIAARSQMLANLLANKDLKFVGDRQLRREAKKAHLTMEDLARLNETQDLWIKLKLGRGGAPEDGGSTLSLWKLVQMIASSAGKAVSGWFFGGEKEDAANAEDKMPDSEEKNSESPKE